MISSYRRYEILLPLRFNNGSLIPDELRLDVLLELERQFGAVSADTQIIRGTWQHAGETYRDELTRVFLDVADTFENRDFLIELKGRLKARFQQLDLWVISFRIDVLP